MNKPWFGRKKIGWGWGLPIRWQGWVLMILYVALITTLSFFVHSSPIFIFSVLLMTAILFAIIWKTSGKPDWGTYTNTSKNKKIILTLLVILLICIFGISQIILLKKAHSTFENYYKFRGCTELIEKTEDYGICKISSGQIIKIVKFQNKWFLDGDLPNCWFFGMCIE